MKDKNYFKSLIEFISKVFNKKTDPEKIIKFEKTNKGLLINNKPSMYNELLKQTAAKLGQIAENKRWDIIIENEAQRLYIEWQAASTITLSDGRTFKNHLVLLNLPSFIIDYDSEEIACYTRKYITEEIFKKFNDLKNENRIKIYI